ncbi:IS30 family transposase [Sphingopyxis sp.]|uniref:IS30 family transposase n=1 Tax=Sphingopyxis sp. TaxID=1908224 RepID=UPI0025DEC743|nr:IS30 family transposase [Sphingopyxis sp.]MBK6413865.1 IS30 family transposase [Sphingopyxis sp.]
MSPAARSERSTQLGRAPSTISREVWRGGGRDRYRGIVSDQAAWDRALRPKPCKLACYPALRRTVSRKLRRSWSPEQIAGWLKRGFPDGEQHRVSHETIYKSLFIQARRPEEGAARASPGEAHDRRSRHASLKRDGLGQIKDAISISEPRFGREPRRARTLEGDLISGARNSHIVTLVERQSRYVILAKVANKGDRQRRHGPDRAKQARKLPRELYQSLTCRIAARSLPITSASPWLPRSVYFCDPQSPWRQGTNENTNRLLRQYLPKEPISPCAAR